MNKHLLNVILHDWYFWEYTVTNPGCLTPGYLYDFEEISSAVEKGLGGLKPAVKCDYDKMLKASVLSQISVCLNKVHMTSTIPFNFSNLACWLSTTTPIWESDRLTETFTFRVWNPWAASGLTGASTRAAPERVNSSTIWPEAGWTSMTAPAPRLHVSLAYFPSYANIFSIPLSHFLFKRLVTPPGLDFWMTCVHVLTTSFSGHLWHHRNPGSRILHLCEDDGNARLRKRLTEDAQEAVMWGET